MDQKAALQVEFGNNMRDARKRQGISQQELGDKIGVGKTYISKIERGTKNIELYTQLRILKALNLGAEILITRDLINKVDLDEPWYPGI